MKTRTGYLVRRGKTFYACYTLGGKKFRQSTHKTDRRQATTELARIMQPFLVENEVRTLETVRARIEGARAELAAIHEARNPPLTIAAAWSTYRQASATADITAGTLRNYEGYWEAFCRWTREAHPELSELRQVSATVAEEYSNALSKRGVTGRTCNAHRAFLRAFWGVLCDPARLATVYTLRDGTQTKNPWATIKPRDEHSLSRRPLTVEELRRVCRSAEGELRTMLAFGLYLGCRMGDAACMNWGNVDMTRRLIRYTPRKTARKNPDPLLIPMHPELAAILGETPPEHREGPVCPDMAARYTEKGQGKVSMIVQRHFEDCGLTTTGERNGAGVRRYVSAGFHSLRHSAVSLLRQAGAAQSVSQAIVGHNSAEIHALYTHTDEDAMRRAVAALPAVMGDMPATALPAPDPLAALKSKMRALAEGMTPDTWQKAQSELLTLAQE